MILEKSDPVADVVIGIDNSMLHRAVSHDLLEPYIPVNIDRLDPTIDFDPDHYIVPFDYGYISILCNGAETDENGDYTITVGATATFDSSSNVGR